MSVKYYYLKRCIFVILLKKKKYISRNDYLIQTVNNSIFFNTVNNIVNKSIFKITSFVSTPAFLQIVHVQ